jgi:FKBP-type peptidyl-prolyl cis-trans isomerase FklB
MKKLLSIVMLSAILFIAVSFSFCTAQAPKASLKTGLDSLSYAYGINLASQGLEQFLLQAGVDSANKADFIQGLLEGSKVSKNDKKEIARLVGISIGQQVATQMLPNINQDLFGSDESLSLEKKQFLAGFVATTLGKNLAISKEQAGTLSETKAAELRAEVAEKSKAKNQTFLDENKTKKNVVTLPSGLQYEVVKEGTGEKPTGDDTVKVDYVGTTIDGKEFDSSIKRGEPAQFPLAGVIRGWTEGIQLMTVGSKYKFYIPYDLAYGERGNGREIGPYATLIFEVDLLDIVKQDPNSGQNPSIQVQ